MIKENTKVKGHCTATLYESEEDYKKRIVKKKYEFDNLILTDGVEIFADLIGGLGGQTKLQCVGAGDNNTAPGVGDTDLIGAELGFKITSNSQIASGKTRYEVTFTAGQATGTWKEAILADTVAAKGARKCASRVSFGDIVKGAGEVLTWVWDISFS